MKSIGLFKAMALTWKADKMTADERTALQQKRLYELILYAKENSPYFSKLYEGINLGSSAVLFSCYKQKRNDGTF